MREKVYGNRALRAQLTELCRQKTVPHAQILIGPEGSEGLSVALEYALQILSSYSPRQESEASLRQRIAHWNVPDLHFSFPISSSHPISDQRMDSWKEFVSKTPYGNAQDWAELADPSKRNWFIGSDEAKNIREKVRLRAFEGGCKVLILWMPELMNPKAANSLLKLFEEPPAQTFFLLVSHRPDTIPPTILSRCVAYRLKPLEREEIARALADEGLDAKAAETVSIQSGGNLRKALKLARDNETFELFQERFVQWVRGAFLARKNKDSIRNLLNWSEEMARLDRGVQTDFLNYCSEVFRWALHLNYGIALEGEPGRLGGNFELRKFAPFVHEGNIEDIQAEIERGIEHINRFVNAKTVFSDLSIRLTRYIHRPSH